LTGAEVERSSGKIRCAFIVPPSIVDERDVERVFGCTYGLYPIPHIFFLGVAAHLKQNGFEVDYVDAANAGWTREQFAEYVITSPANVFCFYSVNLSKRNDTTLCRLILEQRNDATVVFVGPSPTDTPGDFLIGERTYVVRGEPEYTMLELVDALSSGRADFENIQGLSFLRDGMQADNDPRPLIEDLDALPFPAREMLNKDHYYSPKLQKLPFTVINSSRGCPYKCRYCVPNSLSFARELEYKRVNGGNKPPLKLRSAANVIAELEEIKRQGYKSVAFLDDTFTLDKKRTVEICDAIGRLGFQWSCLTRPDCIDEEVAAALSRSKCDFVDIGVESFDQKILDDIKKDLKVEEAVDAIKLLKKHKVRVKLNILLGSSELETRETIREGMRTILELSPDSVMFSICNPFPGTEFWDIAKEKGWLKHDEYRPVDVQKESSISYPHLNGETLEYYVRRYNRKFFLRPLFMMENLKRVEGLRGLANSLKALKKKLF
jgi:radical SAM superfamily enzyme YgiQ (UPF0313 family)